MRITGARPDPARADVGIVLSSEQAVGGRDRLISTADAAVAALAEAPWPGGLLSWSLFLDADGDRLLHYAQWTDEQAVDRAGHTSYRLYRGSRSASGAVPGVIVSVRVDTDDGVVARTWGDAVFEALERDPHLPAGGIRRSSTSGGTPPERHPLPPP